MRLEFGIGSAWFGISFIQSMFFGGAWTLLSINYGYKSDNTLIRLDYVPDKGLKIYGQLIPKRKKK